MANQESDAYVSKHHMAVKALIKATAYISIRSGIQYPKYVVSMDRCACYRNINMKLAALLNAIVVISVLIGYNRHGMVQ